MVGLEASSFVQGAFSLQPPHRLRGFDFCQIEIRQHFFPAESIISDHAE
jgi:hypothetical protein